MYISRRRTRTSADRADRTGFQVSVCVRLRRTEAINPPECRAGLKPALPCFMCWNERSEFQHYAKISFQHSTV